MFFCINQFLFNVYIHMKQKEIDLKGEEISNMYLNLKMGSTKIAKIIGTSHTSILEFLERNNIQRRKDNRNIKKFSLNEDYFKSIDTPNKAYFLGFLYADGCMHNNERCFSIKLQERDKYILDLFCSELKTDKPLNFVKKRKESHQNMINLRIHSKKMALDLIKLGMTPRKSLTLKFPTSEQVPNEFLPHFIRGYFDGDGSVMIPKKKITRCNVVLCVSEEFGAGLKNYLITKNILSSIFKGKYTISRITIGGRKQCLSFYDLIYTNNNELYLNRKLEKFKIIKNFIKKKINSSSKYYGVHFCKTEGKYISKVETFGKTIRFGAFKEEKQAAIAYNEGIKKLGINREMNII